MKLISKVLLLVLLATPAFAYIGPGAGLGALFTLGAVIVGGLLLIIGFVWFPLKRALRKKKGGKAGTSETDT